MQDVVDGIPIVSIAIERAHRHDQSDIFRLVEQNHLPLAGLEEHLDTAFVAREDGRIVGTAAVEMYEDGALLRSVTVAPDAQRKGIGHRLTDDIFRAATFQWAFSNRLNSLRHVVRLPSSCAAFWRASEADGHSRRRSKRVLPASHAGDGRNHGSVAIRSRDFTPARMRTCAAVSGVLAARQ